MASSFFDDWAAMTAGVASMASMPSVSSPVGAAAATSPASATSATESSSSSMDSRRGCSNNGAGGSISASAPAMASASASVLAPAPTPGHAAMDRSRAAKELELQRKRARDRKSQQAMRDRTKWTIANLTEQVAFLTEMLGERARDAGLANSRLRVLEAENAQLRAQNAALHLSLLGSQPCVEISLSAAPGGLSTSDNPGTSCSGQLDAATTTMTAELAHPVTGATEAALPAAAMARSICSAASPSSLSSMNDANNASANNAMIRSSRSDSSSSGDSRTSCTNSTSTSTSSTSTSSSLSYTYSKSAELPPPKPWEIPPMDAPPTCLSDQILQNFISSKVHQCTQNGALAFAVKPNLCALLEINRRSSDAISDIVGDIVRSYFEIDTLPKKVAVFYIMCALLKWTVVLDKPSWDLMPPWLRPTQAQFTTPHAAWIDRIPWPNVRDYLIGHPEITLDHFAAVYSTSFSIQWPYEPFLVLTQAAAASKRTSSGTEDTAINPVYEEHIRQLRNWVVGKPFRDRYPVIGGIIDSDSKCDEFNVR